jgi:predicted TIM-barrel fold metal-dependent hydrolase
METSPDALREEISYVCKLSAQPGSLICGAVANCRIEEDGFETYLDSIANEKLAGLRRICHVERDDFSQNPTFRRNLAVVAERGLTFDLCFLERQLPIAAQLAQAFPDLRFILDHCGVPNIAAGQLDPWRGYINQLAALPNVACKISGVVAYCAPGNGTTAAVRPYVEHCIESFGWDRVVWGGDWPVCTVTASLRQWVAITQEIVAGASDGERHRLFHENAERIYGIGRSACNGNSV